MSVPSSNTSVTDEMPNFEMLRISSSSGRPPIADFDAVGDVLLDFQRRKPGGLVSTMHLRVGHVRHGVDRDLQALYTPPIAISTNSTITRKRLLQRNQSVENVQVSAQASRL